MSKAVSTWVNMSVERCKERFDAKATNGLPWVKHRLDEGSRYHVISYDTNGRHCNIQNCEINMTSKEE